MHERLDEVKLTDRADGVGACHKVSFMQINKMRQNVPGRCTHQGGWRVGINALGQLAGGHRAMAKLRQNCSFAVKAMLGQLGQSCRGFGDGRTVTGQELRPTPRGQLCQRRHVGAHVAIRRRDQR